MGARTASGVPKGLSGAADGNLPVKGRHALGDPIDQLRGQGAAGEQGLLREAAHVHGVFQHRPIAGPSHAGRSGVPVTGTTSR